MSHYDTLGVKTHASFQEIKAAYKKLAMKHHPDTGGDEEEFKKVGQAYEVLKENGSRTEYDHVQAGGTIHQQYDGNEWSGSGAEEMFKDFFEQQDKRRAQAQAKGFSPNQKRQYARKNRDLNIELDIRLEDMIDVKTKHLSVKLSSGDREIIEVDIPSHMDTGQVIRYKGLGDNAIRGLTRGDLFVTINILKHPTYEKAGLDLQTTVVIDCLDAMIGTEELLTTLDGKKLKIKIPPGTQFGTVLNLRNEGLQFQDSTGSIFVRIRVKIPKLTPTEITTIMNTRK